MANPLTEELTGKDFFHGMCCFHNRFGVLVFDTEPPDGTESRERDYRSSNEDYAS